MLFKLTFERRPAFVASSDFILQCRHTRECIEQFEVRVRVEQRLLIALTVYVDKKRSKLAEQRLSCKLMIYEYFVSAVGRKLTPDDDLGAVCAVGVDARGKQQLFKLAIALDRKQSFYESAVAARLKEVRREPAADQHAECIDDDGLARTGLTGEQIKTSVELDSQLIDQRYVRDVEESQHLRG